MASQHDADDPTDGSIGKFIPATQRPDGSWRKARRVKEGYVPQEEVPLYESKGKQWAKKRSSYPPGLNLEDVLKTDAKSQFPTRIIPGLGLTEIEVTKSSKKKKKKKKGQNESTSEIIESQNLEKLEKLSITSHQQDQQLKPQKSLKVTKDDILLVNQQIDGQLTNDPVKKLKNLKKKLREIEVLEKKIKSGELANPEKDQLEKISRKDDIETQIDDLESELKDS